jgi:hypothetical protein
MAARYIIVDHDTPLLLPPDLREWVPENHLVHFIMDAVEQIDLGAAKVNERGTGDARYPPWMLLALLIYSYATGMFSSKPSGSDGSRCAAWPKSGSNGRWSIVCLDRRGHR